MRVCRDDMTESECANESTSIRQATLPKLQGDTSQENRACNMQGWAAQAEARLKQ